MKIRVYKNNELIGEYNAYKKYEESFYFREMPILSKKRSREIIKKANNGILYEKDLFVLENIEDGYQGVQEIYKDGTILNF